MAGISHREKAKANKVLYCISNYRILLLFQDGIPPKLQYRREMLGGLGVCEEPIRQLLCKCQEDRVDLLKKA
jgi:hypothetical protein